MQNILEIKQISASAGNFFLRNISFTVNDGDYFAILGHSGAGKTILLECIAGIRDVTHGHITLAGNDITHVPIFRRRVGIVFQECGLFPHYTVAQNIKYPLYCARVSRAESAARVENLAHKLNIEHLLDRNVTTLSGGEAQRVALARAIAVPPSLLLLDEPLSSLDTAAKTHLRALLRSLNRDGLTMVHVTHDFEEALSLAHNALILENGQVVQNGELTRIAQEPKCEFAAAFAGVRNFFAVSLQRNKEQTVALCGHLIFPVSHYIDREPHFVEIPVTAVEIVAGGTALPNVFEATVVDSFDSPQGASTVFDCGVLLHFDGQKLPLGERVFLRIDPEAIHFH